MREIADEVGAYLMVDMAHIAGLVASGYHESPIPYAHVTTTTTHRNGWSGNSGDPRMMVSGCGELWRKRVGS